jgi:hypothetical protein
MKLEDFKTYQSEIKMSGKILTENVESKKIYNWMDETDRLNEGLLGSIWKWLKRNFSVTSRKLHSLADEYGKELTEELRADYLKTKNPKDLGAKFRAGSYNRLSRDIEDRMDIVAGDDEDYRLLAKTLVNKKNLEVKKALLVELSGKFDPDDYESLEKETGEKLRTATSEYEKSLKPLTGEKKDIFEKILKFMERKMEEEKALYHAALIRTSDERNDFIKLLFQYIDALSEKNKSISLDTKTMLRVAREYLKMVKTISKKVASDKISEEEAVKMVKNILNKFLKETKPKPIEDLNLPVSKEAEKLVKTSAKASAPDEDPEEVLTTSKTEEIIKKMDVDDAIDTAAEETGKSEPKPSDIIAEVNDFIKSYLERNISVFTDRLARRVEDFNNLDKIKKDVEIDDYDYNLDSEDRLKKPTPQDVKNLYSSFIDIAGAIVPYYQRKTEDDAKVCAKTVLDFMFEIYAVKKDASSRIVDSEKTKIVQNIKKRYPEDFK